MSVVSAIKSTAITGLVKAAGAAAIGASVYDAHVLAKIQSDQFVQEKEADMACEAFQNTMYQEQPSAVMSGIKKEIFKFQTDHNFFAPINAVVGYVKGFASMIADHFIPVALGTLALFGKGKAVPRTSALGLLIYGGYQVLREGFGLGRVSRLNPPYKN